MGGVPERFLAGNKPAGRAVMVVLRKARFCCRWNCITHLRDTALAGLDPAAILFVEYEPAGQFFTLLRWRWSERLLSYCFAGATPLSDIMVIALGLRTRHWRAVTAPRPLTEST
jgi:hypothetical protein